MTDSEGGQGDRIREETKRKNASAIIESIWQRARINAFAHKLSGKRATKRSTVLFVLEVLFSLLSILSVILVYVFAKADGAVLYATLASVVFSLIALFLGILASHLKLDVTAAEHKFLLGSYQHIAQRAREAKWPDMPAADVVELLHDLERDFALLKARGSEPDDEDFVGAHELLKKIKGDPLSKAAQSYDPPIDVPQRPLDTPRTER